VGSAEKEVVAELSEVAMGSDGVFVACGLEVWSCGTGAMGVGRGCFVRAIEW
jgi:hypothetical protein